MLILLRILFYFALILDGIIGIVTIWAYEKPRISYFVANYIVRFKTYLMNSI